MDTNSERTYGYLLCVYSSSGAMGKVSKPVAAVAAVAISLYCSPCLMSHVWALSPPVPLPIPFSLSKHWRQCVVCNLVTRYPKCGSCVIMYMWF